MKHQKLLFHAIFNTVMTLIYVACIGWILFNANDIFKNNQGFWPVVAFLLLFVLSALIVGFLILGRPIYLYFNDAKKEAIQLLILTISCLAIISFSVVLYFILR